MEILEKVGSIIKNKFNSELTYGKKYLKVKKIYTKGECQCLYAPIIMIDSIYRKGENNYPKMFFEKYYFVEDIEIYCSNSDEKYYDKERLKIYF